MNNNSQLWNSPTGLGVPQGMQDPRLTQTPQVGTWNAPVTQPITPATVQPIQPINSTANTMQFGSIAPMGMQDPRLSNGVSNQNYAGNLSGVVTPEPSTWGGIGDSIKNFFGWGTNTPSFAELEAVRPQYQAYKLTNPDSTLTLEDYAAKMQEGVGSSFGWNDATQLGIAGLQGILGYQQLGIAKDHHKRTWGAYDKEQAILDDSRARRQERADRTKAGYDAEQANNTRIS